MAVNTVELDHEMSTSSEAGQLDDEHRNCGVVGNRNEHRNCGVVRTLSTPNVGQPLKKLSRDRKAVDVRKAHESESDMSCESAIRPGQPPKLSTWLKRARSMYGIGEPSESPTKSAISAIAEADDAMSDDDTDTDCDMPALLPPSPPTQVERRSVHPMPDRRSAHSVFLGGTFPNSQPLDTVLGLPSENRSGRSYSLREPSQFWRRYMEQTSADTYGGSLDE